MTERRERWDRITGPFTERVGQVPPERWDDPAPCEGSVARDVVRHLVEWVPGLLTSSAGIEPPAIPSVDDDPVEVADAADEQARLIAFAGRTP